MSKGAGAPLAIIGEFASCFGAEFAEDAPAELQFMLRETLSFYLRTSSDDDGSLLYRLFHQGVVDILTADDSVGRTSQYITGLIEDPASMGTPYFQRHLVEHASDVDQGNSEKNCLARLWLDPVFLANAVPAIARTYPPRDHDRQARRAWEIYSWCHFAQDTTFEHRLSVLTATASRWKDADLLSGLQKANEGSALRPRWGTMKERTEQVYLSPNAPTDGLYETPYVYRPGTIAVMEGDGIFASSATHHESGLTVNGWTSGLVTVAHIGGATRRYKVSKEWASAVAISRDGSCFAVGGADGIVRVFEIDGDTLRIWSEHQLGGRVITLAVGGSGLFAAGLESGFLISVNGLRRKTHQFSNGQLTTSIVASADFGRIYVAVNTGALLAWDPTFGYINAIPVPESDRVLDQIDYGERPSRITSMALSDDDRLLLTGTDSGHFRRWDAAAARPLGEAVRVGKTPIRWIGISRDGLSIITKDSDFQRRWDLFSSAQLEQGTDGPPSVAKVVVVGERVIHVGQRSVHVYSLADGREAEDSWGRPSGKAHAHGSPENRQNLRAEWAGLHRGRLHTSERSGTIRRWTQSGIQWRSRVVGHISSTVIEGVSVRKGLALLDADGGVWLSSATKITPIEVPQTTILGSMAGDLLLGHPDGSVGVFDAGTSSYRSILDAGSAVTALIGAGTDIWVGRLNGSLTHISADGTTVDVGRLGSSTPIGIWPARNLITVVRANGTVDRLSRNGRILSSTRTGLAALTSFTTEDGTLSIANTQDVLVLESRIRN